MLFHVLILLTWLTTTPVLVSSLAQTDLDYMSSFLNVRYDVIDNFIDTWLQYKARVTLSNKRTIAVTKGNWAIYFCSIRIVEPDHLPHNPQGYIVPGGPGVKLTHINGCLHKMEPTDDFEDLGPGSEVKVEFKVKYFAVARTDIMPNWYVAASGLEPRTIKNTIGEGLEFVGDFKSEKQWRRYTEDQYHPYSPEQRYDKIDIKDLGASPLLLIPTPLHVSGWNNTQRMSLVKTTWTMSVGSGLKNEATFLAENVNDTKRTPSMPDPVKDIKLELGDPNVTIAGKKSTNQEAYSLDVDVSKLTIKVVGLTSTAVFYGIQSLLAMIDEKGTVPKVTIKDVPRYEYRGMHLDVGRNFKSKKTVLRFLDMLAAYKFNKFHFHLCEDEGWRLEIPGLEELTQVGSKRCHDLQERKCLIPQLGSPPEGTTTRQHYTQSEYQEILRHAKKLHIEVIPEFDMPGHSHAAIKSMEARYHRLKTVNVTDAEKYLLTELGDPSRYMTVQWFTDDATNPCIESTYNFVEHVVEELVRMHQSIQPLKLYHFGGDEVAKGAWTNSSACKKLASRLGYDFKAKDIVDKLKDYFVQRVANITQEKGLGLAGWEDGLLGPNYVPYKRENIKNDNVYGYAWRGGGQRTHNLANAGYKVVLSQATYNYFDHPYEPDPEERGYYWAARYTDTRKTFGFIPENLYANVRVNRWGKAVTREKLCKEDGSCPELKKKENIVGMAGALWTETVRTADQMDSMIYPRLLALAERAWHKASWEDISDETERDKKTTEDWEKFANFLGYTELKRLDRLGIKYHIPVPGAKSSNRKILTKTAIPGLTVQYSDDNGQTWRDIPDEVHGKVLLATRSADGRRLSRSVEYQGSTVKSSSPTPSVNHCLVLISVISLVWCVFSRI
ncbi:uncharacterized protein LOC116300354 [Actinia tenebrosa]|uniref:beta-N-acetylhexosaminidase n=1 Tax=Actinia tenebrosa TaxID=6105 RepID=A0A6P8IC66_ACTTE|nr:uncharacterized protein LOC116300354 [Actinia tenebrosa]